jgi:hypothetical protein
VPFTPQPVLDDFLKRLYILRLKGVKYSKPKKCKQTTKKRLCKSIAILQNASKPGKLQLFWDKKTPWRKNTPGMFCSKLQGFV